MVHYISRTDISPFKNIDINQHNILCEDYLAKLAKSTRIDFIDEQLQLHAYLNCTTEYVTRKFYGYVELGEETFGPSGEVSITPKISSRENLNNKSVYESPPIIKLNGDIILHGYCVINRQVPVKFSPNPVMESIFTSLDTLREGRLKVRLNEGNITKIEVVDVSAKPAYDLLSALFLTDDRYKSLLEIGYGVDTQNQVANGNTLTNEFYGGEKGCFHFGFGSSITNYHIDIVCPYAIKEEIDGVLYNTTIYKNIPCKF
ncbi:MAG: hypothetical protein P1U74_08035 [Legionellaceae bacterium]|nr:hypothetical protein [Legionellaceae bacterium]